MEGKSHSACVQSAAFFRLRCQFCIHFGLVPIFLWETLRKTREVALSKHASSAFTCIAKSTIVAQSIVVSKLCQFHSCIEMTVCMLARGVPIILAHIWQPGCLFAVGHTCRSVHACNAIIWLCRTCATACGTLKISGDMTNLFGIAVESGVSIRDLLAVNAGIETGKPVQAGTTLVRPCYTQDRPTYLGKPSGHRC